MFTIYVLISGQWAEFLPLARERSVMSQKEADNIGNYTNAEDIAVVISYFADDIQWGPPSNFWKVIGPPSHKLPSWSSATYEEAGA